MNQNNHLLHLSQLTVGYGEIIVLDQVDLVIHEKDFIGVIGPNGGGKTTLLKAILGLLTPMQGKIEFSPLMTNGKQHLIGYLPQINNIDRKFPITVYDVVRSGLLSRNRLTGRFSREENDYAEALLQEMGIAHLRMKPIGELSGGQIQRTLLCRSLVNHPKLLILDEPNTYVDNRFERELYEKLRVLNEQLAILLVSHDLGTISSYVKSFACVNGTLHYHDSNEMTPELLRSYDCPIKLVTHGEVPHTVLHNHQS